MNGMEHWGAEKRASCRVLWVWYVGLVLIGLYLTFFELFLS